MAFCTKCGTQINDDQKFCPVCGEEVKQQQNEQTENKQTESNATTVTPTTNQSSTGYFTKEDAEKNKMMAVLAYILFLIPLLAAKESPFAKYHTNQGLVLFIGGVIVSILGSVIPFLGWFVILPIGGILVTVLCVMGILNALKGEAKPLPIIGKIKILK